MKSVAIVGMGPSWGTALDSEADEKWLINYFYEMKGITPDRVFDIHDLYWYRDSQEKVDKHKSHWEQHLTKKKDYIFYAPLDYPEVPDLTVYPLDKVMALLKPFKRATDDGDMLVRFFTSSFDYLMALAITEGFDRIELHGWRMGWSGGNETEYRYQQPGLAFWTGMAVSRGIEVVISDKSPIFKIKQYTFEGDNQVITRQTLETFRQGWEIRLQEKQAEFNKTQGSYESMVALANEEPDNQLYRDSAQAGLLRVNNAFKEMMHAEGCFGMIMHLIEEVDLGETNLDIQSNLVSTADEAVAKALAGEK